MIGKQIQKIRNKHEYSQRELAEAVDITITHLSHVENGRADPSLALLRRIAEELDVDISIKFVRQGAR